LGYLLHKNPNRLQSFDLSFGKAHVFYPEASASRCTAALLLDVDPVGLVRTRRGPSGEGGMLDQYVNDRPYVASSFMSVAIARVFNSALAGNSKDRPELVTVLLPLTARVAVLPCRGGEEFLRRLFEPLGYHVIAEHHPLDEKFPEWGEGPYYTVEISKSVTALCVPGNHDMKLLQKLRGKGVKMAHGLVDSVAQLETEPPEFKSRVAEFIDSLISHYVLDDGKLVVAHAGMKEEMQGRGSGAIRSFALFGETTGETDEFGLPVRYNWAADYRGKAMVVYGHTPIAEPQWLNRTVNIDTGCVFGGKLTALRYPEKEFVSTPAHRTYYEPAKPLVSTQAAIALSQQHEQDDVLDIDDVIGKRIVETRLHGNLTVREENAIAALEVMSRFASNPKWLIYLPPTMSPSETTKQPGSLGASC
jgi:diadenosine tetraphosphatase ApaH/serine/threonine PP2A family protein phosphatase